MKRFSKIACWLVPLLSLLVGILRLHHGWDDGAITAAFARTFLQTGRMGLTPSSVQVEGFSSLLWMLVLSAGDVLFRSVNGMLAWTKIASAISFSLGLFVFARLSRKFLQENYASLAVLLLAFTITPFTETNNGMEMNLYMLLVLTLTSVLIEGDRLQPGSWLVAVVLSFSILLTRFEAPYLLFFLFVGIGLGSHGKRIGLVLLSVVDLLLFAAVELWRHSTFQKWLPNTVYAKRWIPYTAVGLKHQLMSRGLATAEILIVFAFPLLFLGALVLAQTVFPRTGKAQVGGRALSPVVVTMSVGALGLGLGMGQNWGHPGRMILAFLPFVLVAIVSAFEAIAKRNSLDQTRLIAVVLAGQCVFWVLQAGLVARGNSVPYTYSAEVGLAAEKVREILDTPTLSVFIPDIGGASLCCAQLDVMDSALLANPSLSMLGYTGVRTFVATKRPDVIETHEPWSSAGHLYDLDVQSSYGIVEVQGKYLFVRDDLYHRLIARGFTESSDSGGGQSGCVTEAEADRIKSTDLLYLLKRGKCIVISKEPVRL